MSSLEFAEWCSFLEIEPDIGTRADFLATAIASHIGRVEGTMGGKPQQINGKLIQWDRRQNDDDNAMAAYLMSLNR